MRGQSGLLLEDDHRQVGVAEQNGPCGGEAEDPGSDDGDIDSFHVLYHAALMTSEALIALGNERREVLKLYRSLDDDEWALPSDCAGWSVQDVLAHLSASFHPTRSLARALRNPDIEEVNEVLVAERRRRTPGEQLVEYETWAGRAIAVLGLFQRRPFSSLPVPLANLGTHPAHWLANAAVFDHYTHLRVDLLAPFGPIDREPPPSDPLRLRPTIAWMIELVSVLAGPALADLDGEVELRLVGPGGGLWTLEGAVERCRIRRGPALSAAARVTSTTQEFPIWGTKRRDWRTRDVELSGDEDLAEKVVDALHLV